MVSCLSSPALSQEVKMATLSPYFEALLRLPPSLRTTLPDLRHNPQVLVGVDRHPLGAATMRFLFLFEDLYGPYFMPSKNKDGEGGMKLIKRRVSWGWDDTEKEGAIAGGGKPGEGDGEDVLGDMQLDVQTFLVLLRMSIRKMWKRVAER